MSCKCNNWTIITMITDHFIIFTPQEKDNLLITVNLSLESKLPEGKPAYALIVYASPMLWLSMPYQTLSSILWLSLYHLVKPLLIHFTQYSWSVWSPWSGLLLISFEWPQFHCLAGRISTPDWGWFWHFPPQYLFTLDFLGHARMTACEGLN